MMDVRQCSHKVTSFQATVAHLAKLCISVCSHGCDCTRKEFLRRSFTIFYSNNYNL